MQGSICRERMVSNTISLPPLGFHTAVRVRAKQGERITEVLFQCAQITPQKPIVHAELFAPGGYRMRLIDNNHTDAAVADKMSDVIGEQQLRRKIKQVDFPLTHRPVHSIFCSGERSEDAYATRSYPTSCKPSTWSTINAFKGETTIVSRLYSFPRIDGGELEQERLPAPVGAVSRILSGCSPPLYAFSASRITFSTSCP